MDELADLVDHDPTTDLVLRLVELELALLALVVQHSASCVRKLARQVGL